MSVKKIISEKDKIVANCLTQIELQLKTIKGLTGESSGTN